jgi:hypothetical protein
VRYLVYLLKLLGVGVLGFVGLVLALVGLSWVFHARKAPEARQDALGAEKVAQAAEARAQAEPAAGSAPAVPSEPSEPWVLEPSAAEAWCAADAQDQFKGVDWGWMDLKLVGSTTKNGVIVVTVDGGKRDGVDYRLVCRMPTTAESREDAAIQRELFTLKGKKATKAKAPADCLHGFENTSRNRGKCKTVADARREEAKTECLKVAKAKYPDIGWGAGLGLTQERFTFEGKLGLATSWAGRTPSKRYRITCYLPDVALQSVTQLHELHPTSGAPLALVP